MKKIVLITTTVIVPLILVGAAFVVINKKNKDTPDVQNTVSSQDKVANQDEGGLPDVKNQKVSDEEARVYISNISQDVSTVYVKTVVEGATQGICIIEFKKTGFQDIRRTAPLIPVTSYHACEGFNIAKQEFPARGEWVILIKLENGNSTAEKAFHVK